MHNINLNYKSKLLLFVFVFIILFFFSIFYTAHYPNINGGDEVFYMNLATKMIGLPFWDRVVIGITQMLNFGWPVFLSYYPDFSLESNIPLTFVRIFILTISVFYFYRSYKIHFSIMILLIPFLFQASIYAGTLIRDDLIFSFYLIVLGLLKNLSTKTLPLALICFIFLITLRVPLIISSIPFLIMLMIRLIKRSKSAIYFVPFLLLSFYYLIFYLGIANYITSAFLSSLDINFVDMIRPFLSPINPFLVSENIRYDNPIIFILMSPAKLFFIISSFLLIFYKNKFSYYNQVMFILFSAIPYMFIAENLGMRQALPIQFCLYAIIINSSLNIRTTKSKRFA